MRLPDHVVNFSLPEAGRNINYAIVEEMLTKKRPQAPCHRRDREAIPLRTPRIQVYC